MIVAISFALALFLSTALVPVVIRYANVLGLVDEPDGDRKVHLKPIPRVGGVAIALSFFVPTLLWLGSSSALMSFLVGGAIIAIFGFLDDRHDLNYKWKFFGQLIAVAIFLSGHVEITKTPFLGLGDIVPWLSYPLLMLFLLGVTNAVNLSDGLDGLAAGSSLLSLGFLAFLAYGATNYSLAIAAVSAMGALVGFLRYNTHPATVFMGDTGSQFLGYVAGCLAVMVTQSPKLPVSPMLAILILGLPILDTLIVMLLRLRDGSSPFKPDQRHLHHQFLAIGLQHYQAVATLYILNFILLVLAYFMRYQSDGLVLGAYLFFCSTTLALIAFFKHSAFSRRRRARLSADDERRNTFFRRMHWMHQHGVVLVQYLLGAIWLLFAVVGNHVSGWLDWGALLILLAVAIYWRFYNFDNRVLARLIFYAASVLSIFLISYGVDIDVPAWRSLNILDIPLAILVMALSLAIRTTRKDHFRVDTQDMLVLLVLLSAPILSMSVDDEQIIVGAIFRLAILLYASEYIVTRMQKTDVIAKIAGLSFIIFLVTSFAF